MDGKASKAALSQGDPEPVRIYVQAEAEHASSLGTDGGNNSSNGNDSTIGDGNVCSDSSSSGGGNTCSDSSGATAAAAAMAEAPAAVVVHLHASTAAAAPPVAASSAATEPHPQPVRLPPSTLDLALVAVSGLAIAEGVGLFLAKACGIDAGIAFTAAHFAAVAFLAVCLELACRRMG